MLLRRLSIATALILSLGSSVVLLHENSVLAKTPGQSGKTNQKNNNGIMEKLNLTPEQKTKIQAIQTKYKPQMKEKRQALKKAMEEKRTLMKNSATDEQRKTQMKKIQALKQEIRDLSSESKSEIRKVLTSEQLKKFDEMEKNRKSKTSGGL